MTQVWKFCATNRRDVSVFRSTHRPKCSMIGLKLRIKTLFLCVNVSKEYFPWYMPIPLSPTPPNGNVSTRQKIIIGVQLVFLVRAITRDPIYIANSCSIIDLKFKFSENLRAMWNITSLMQTPPLWVCVKNKSCTFVLFENTYNANGFGLWAKFDEIAVGKKFASIEIYIQRNGQIFSCVQTCYL